MSVEYDRCTPRFPDWRAFSIESMAAGLEERFSVDLRSALLSSLPLGLAVRVLLRGIGLQ